jgi:hypothetical protein
MPVAVPVIIYGTTARTCLDDGLCRIRGTFTGPDASPAAAFRGDGRCLIRS